MISQLTNSIHQCINQQNLSTILSYSIEAWRIKEISSSPGCCLPCSCPLPLSSWWDCSSWSLVSWVTCPVLSNKLSMERRHLSAYSSSARPFISSFRQRFRARIKQNILFSHNGYVSWVGNNNSFETQRFLIWQCNLTSAEYTNNQHLKNSKQKKANCICNKCITFFFFFSKYVS